MSWHRKLSKFAESKERRIEVGYWNNATTQIIFQDLNRLDIEPLK